MTLLGKNADLSLSSTKAHQLQRERGSSVQVWSSWPIRRKTVFPKNQNKAPFHLFYHWRIASHLLPSCFWSVSGLISGLPPHCFWSVSKLFLICFWSVSGLDSGPFLICFYPVSGPFLFCFWSVSLFLPVFFVCLSSASCQLHVFSFFTSTFPTTSPSHGCFLFFC